MDFKDPYLVAFILFCILFIPFGIIILIRNYRELKRTKKEATEAEAKLSFINYLFDLFNKNQKK